MGIPAPDAVKRLVDARDMTEMSDISDRVPSPADRKFFLYGDFKEEQLPKAKMPQERESIERQIEATDKAIDALVYKLYGLTEEEIRIVEAGQ
jgi:hypothetical protein